MHTYVINMLEKEKKILEDCLTKWDKETYPEAEKERQYYLKQLNDVLEKLKGNERFGL